MEKKSYLCMMSFSAISDFKNITEKDHNTQLPYKTMKKILIAILTLLVATHCATALPISLQKARDIAVKAYLSHGGNAADTIFSEVGKKAGFSSQYIFVAPEGKGFVIVAADDCVKSLLAISTQSAFELPMPPSVEEWLRSYDQQIAYYKKLSASNTKARKSGDNDVFVIEDYWFVGPLIESQWTQDDYYNNKCPTIQGQHCVVGCVATAMAQVMRYWKYPERGTGSNTYLQPDVGLVYANFNVRYNWDKMPIALTSRSTREQVNAVAQLNYHCGVAVNMEYGIDGSYAYFHNAHNALIRNFSYSSHSRLCYMSQYSDEEWKLMLKNEIDASRPIIYAGVTTNEEGHAFICDGYDSEGDFHINWGWGGVYDGFFAIGNLRPAGVGTGASEGYAFDLYNMAIIGLMPATLDCSDVIVNRDTMVCDSLTLNGVTYTNSQIIETSETLPNGCDSIDRLILLVRQPERIDTGAVACDSLVWHGETYRASGTYQHRAVAQRPKCDTIYEIKLKINSSTAADTHATACQSFLWHGDLYTATGAYPSLLLANSLGCDSLVTLHLTINQPSQAHADTTVCDHLSLDGFSVTADTSLTLPLLNHLGCDSLLHLDVTILHSSVRDTALTACDQATWRSQIYTLSGSYRHYLGRAHNGCDSLVRLAATIKASSSGYDYVEAEGSYIWNGKTLTASGIYYDTLTNLAGCDSLVTLNLNLTVGLPTALTAAPQVFVQHTTIVVRNAMQQPVSIYDIQGRRLFHTEAATADCRYKPIATGNYIVTVGNRAHPHKVTILR